MSIEKNKEIVKRLFEEVFNNRNIVVLDEFIAPNYTNHNASIQVNGLDGLKRAFEVQFKAFPDLNTSLEDIIAEGNKVVVRCTDHFTHQPDGKQESIPWIEILRLENGKLVEAWLETDTRLFSGQLLNEIQK